ncbi:hypothetical protein SADUNF_Sadunf16G0309600 [Salix dunnii]|uniref:Uncharacterized protein n=1 Tax=Salix dunnii TaxID=1413687 RepID=A0A835JBS8_9ROSI|nr:hypothetical protein SADUNF_Sadunf16G0309600 [Salix dunnii]
MFKNLADPAHTLDSLFFYTGCYEREAGRAFLKGCSKGGPLFSSVSPRTCTKRLRTKLECSTSSSVHM